MQMPAKELRASGAFSGIAQRFCHEIAGYRRRTNELIFRDSSEFSSTPRIQIVCEGAAKKSLDCQIIVCARCTLLRK
jgi:hypothetical protein